MEVNNRGIGCLQATPRIECVLGLNVDHGRPTLACDPEPVKGSGAPSQASVDRVLGQEWTTVGPGTHVSSHEVGLRLPGIPVFVGGVSKATQRLPGNHPPHDSCPTIHTSQPNSGIPQGRVLAGVDSGGPRVISGMSSYD